MADAPRPMADIPAEFVDFKYPLPHLAQAFSRQGAGQDRRDRIVVDRGQRATSCLIRIGWRCICGLDMRRTDFQI